MSPKITKIHVEKGYTKQTSKEEWFKTSYQLEADVSDVASEDEIEELRLHLCMKLDDWLLQERGINGPPDVNVGDIPQIDLATLEEAGWQTFQKKPCMPGEAGWVKNPVEFTSWHDPPQILLALVKAIHKTSDKKLVLGNLEYFLSKKFINRKPVKRESAK